MKKFLFLLLLPSLCFPNIEVQVNDGLVHSAYEFNAAKENNDLCNSGLSQQQLDTIKTTLANKDIETQKSAFNYMDAILIVGGCGISGGLLGGFANMVRGSYIEEGVIEVERTVFNSSEKELFLNSKAHQYTMRLFRGCVDKEFNNYLNYLQKSLWDEMFSSGLVADKAAVTTRTVTEEQALANAMQVKIPDKFRNASCAWFSLLNNQKRRIALANNIPDIVEKQTRKCMGTFRIRDKVTFSEQIIQPAENMYHPYGLMTPYAKGRSVADLFYGEFERIAAGQPFQSTMNDMMDVFMFGKPNSEEVKFSHFFSENTWNTFFNKTLENGFYLEYGNMIADNMFDHAVNLRWPIEEGFNLVRQKGTDILVYGKKGLIYGIPIGLLGGGIFDISYYAANRK